MYKYTAPLVQPSSQPAPTQAHRRIVTTPSSQNENIMATDSTLTDKKGNTPSPQLMKDRTTNSGLNSAITNLNISNDKVSTHELGASQEVEDVAASNSLSTKGNNGNNNDRERKDKVTIEDNDDGGGDGTSLQRKGSSGSIKAVSPSISLAPGAGAVPVEKEVCRQAKAISGYIHKQMKARLKKAQEMMQQEAEEAAKKEKREAAIRKKKMEVSLYM